MLDMEDNLLGTLVPIYLPPTKEIKYKFDKNVLLKDAKSEPLSKRIQKGNKASVWQKKINELFVEETKIDHYDLEEISQMNVEKNGKDGKGKGEGDDDKVTKSKSKKK